MSSLRDCCRHPRASSPALPNIQLVPSPTQDEGYDADAIRIATPDGILMGSVHPGPDESRPSCDTIVHHELVQRPDKKLDDDEGGSSTGPKSVRERVNSIHIPRRRAKSQSQPLSSPSSAALEQYVKISPSRTALRKRLEAVKIIDEGELPSSPKLEPARTTSIPKSSIPSHWRLSYDRNSSSYRRPVLREVDTNEHRDEIADEGQSKLVSSIGRTEAASLQPVGVPSHSVENERQISNDISESYSPAPRKRSLAFSEGSAYAMPGSYQSNFTEVSVHLQDMQISERVASSNSNIVAMGDWKVQRRRSSTTSHPRLNMVPPRYQHSRESSSLQSPKESSSVYSSNEDELASSRRSSMLLIKGLPERIQRLKNHATSEDLYSTSAQHSQITVIQRSRFPTTFTDDPRQPELSEKESRGTKWELDGEDVYEEKSRSPPLRRASTEPRLNRFIRGDPASFDGSGEWHLAPPSRQPTGLLPRQPNSLSVRQPTGLLARQPTGLLPTEDASIWEKALRDHAQEDKAISQVRSGSISYEIGRDDFRRRLRSRRFTRTPSPLQEITEDPWSQRRERGSDPASGRVSPAHASPKRGSPTMEIGPQVATRQASSSTRSVNSWTRYPSHTFAERTETANAKDNVITRDFALGLNSPHKISKKKSRSMIFGRRFLHKVGRLYKTRSSDFRRYNAGHRSSVSVGGVLEYPELEIPRASFEPVLLSGPRGSETDSTTERQAALKEAIKTPIPSSPQHVAAEQPKMEVGISSPGLKAVEWQRKYDDCVVRPRNTSTDDEIAPDEIGPLVLELDEAQQAEVDQAKDEALKAADECLRRSMEL
ncbi:MAG: hypothetical protein Q9170_005190, partial [Blastenia crenularia]